ncbi:Mitochondrial distribution and morphology protein 12, partial [Coemansia sp. S85]
YFGSQADTAYQTPILPGELAVERGEDDMQLIAKVEYCGDMSLVLRTELQLNYPATQFASLPVTLHITRIEFSATAVIAYLPGRVNLCFLEPEPPHTSLLRSFAIRTEVGDAHQHVLKNVEKLELFITEQLRQAIDDDFVFPSAEEILNGQEEQPEQMDTLEEPVRVCIEQLSAYYNDDDLMAQVVHLLETGEKAKEAGRLKLVALDAQRNAAEIEAKSLQVDAKIAEKIEELKTLRGEKADLARQGRAGNIQLAESVKAWEIAVTAANGGPHLPSTAEMELRKTQQTLEQTQKELSQLKLARALGGPQGLARPGNKAPA